MAGINDYSNTAGSNTTINGIDIAEGCSPAGINNAIRQLMADIADMDDGVVPLQTPDINGGTIDGAIIGGTTPAAGTFTTITTTGDINFGDNDKAVFGAGSDLQIYHDTSNSYIVDNGTGNLFIRGSNLILEDSAGNDFIAMADTGAGGTVSLKHNAVTKLTTTSTGINVTGTVTATAFSGDGSALTGVGGGITEADQWRLTTAFTNDAQPIASNLERNDTSFSYIGTGMTESSGVFTFPSTGIYLVKYNITTIIGGNGEDGKVNPLIEITTDGTNFSTVADSQFNLADDSNGTVNRGCAELNTIFDVTNTSTHKVRFTILVNNTSTQINGSSTDNRTYFTFIRLGDT